MIPEARNQSGVSMPVDVEDMRTATAMLAASGLKPLDIADALRVDVNQVRAWLLPPSRLLNSATEVSRGQKIGIPGHSEPGGDD